MAATAPKTPTPTQLATRAELGPAEYSLMQEMNKERLTAAGASPGTARFMCLVRLCLAGYAYAWGQVCYLTEAGKAWVNDNPQPVQDEQ
jgi:hypothetical protein